MVDNPSPPVMLSPDPPEDAGPEVGSDAWTAVQETKSKRKAFGAGVSFPADEKIRKFSFEMNFKENINDTTTSTVNLHALHKEFIEKLLTLTDGDTHLLPTAKETNSEANSTTRSPILSADAFPATDKLHRKFFHRHIRFNDYKKCTVVTISHEVLMKETVAQVKSKLMEWLQSKRVWMKNGELDGVETNSIGWLLAAHGTLVFKPAVAERLNFLIANLPKATVDKQIDQLGSKEDKISLPRLFINSKWQAFGNDPGRVMTQAVTISCVKNRARLMKELISLIPADAMPYTFIPIGLATMETPEIYMKFIMINNDRQNEVQGLIVKGFSKELLTRPIDETKKDSRTVAEYFLSFPSIVSIQQTHQTQEFGKFIFIVLKKLYQEARTMLSDFCEEKFKLIYQTQDKLDQYRVTYKSLPHLSDSPTAGGATASHSAGLAVMLAAEEKRTGKKFSSSPSTTWAHKVAPHFYFDKNSKHPSANSATNATDNIVPITPNATTTTQITTNPMTPAQNKKANPDTTDTNSLSNSIGSSTIAHGTQATSSGHTMVSQVSQDLSSVMSQMKSMASDQSKFFEKLFENQDKQARRAARDAKIVADETRKFNQQMMSMMMTMLQDSKTTPQVSNHTTAPQQRRMTRQEQQQDSPMWQSSNRNKNSATKDVPNQMDYDDDLPATNTMIREIAQYSPSEIDQLYNDNDTKAASKSKNHTTEQDNVEDYYDDEEDNEEDCYEEDAQEDNEYGLDTNDDMEGIEDDAYETNDSEDQDYEVDDEYYETKSNTSDENHIEPAYDDTDDESTNTTAIEAALNTKHNKGTQGRPIYREPRTTIAYVAPPSTPKKPKTPSKSLPRVKASYMSPSEALQHAAAAIQAKKAELQARDEKKHQLRTTTNRTSQSLRNKSTTTTQSQNNSADIADISTPLVAPPTSPPSSQTNRIRRRSPGQTPDNDTKLQRTGTAPSAPSTHDEIARSLNFEDNLAPSSTVKEPDPHKDSSIQQE